VGRYLVVRRHFESRDITLHPRKMALHHSYQRTREHSVPGLNISTGTMGVGMAGSRQRTKLSG
jgi:hypothetical protein